MIKLFYLTASALLITFWSHAQVIQINSDGTHTTVFNNGNTSIQVNQDGTQSTIFHNGNTAIQVNADGSHSTIFTNGNTSIRVNPNGTHIVIFNPAADTGTAVNSDDACIDKNHDVVQRSTGVDIETGSQTKRNSGTENQRTNKDID
jgi:hypothetical protein